MIGTLKKACIKNDFYDITFIRVSCIQNNEETLQQLTELSFSIVLEMCDDGIADFVTNFNGNSIGVIGKLKGRGMFNICCTSLCEIDQPFIRIEVVSDQGMLVYDTSQEDAFLGKYQLPLYNSALITDQAKEVVAQIDWLEKENGEKI